MGSFFEGSAPPTALSSQSTAATYPDWYNQYIQTTANRVASAGSMPYVASPIPFTAGLSQDQLGASGILRQAEQGPGQRYAIGAGQIDQAANMTGGLETASPYLANATKTFTGDTVNEYLNPFNTAVTDRLAALAGRNLSENLLPKVNDTFIGSGQFGSSGNSEFTSRALRDTQEGLLGQQAMTLQDQFNKSASIFDRDASRSLGAANTAGGLANSDRTAALAIGDASNRLGSTLFNNNIQQAAGLASIGNTAQATSQRGLDAANQEFARQRDYPMAQAQFLANNAQALRPQAGMQSVSTRPLNETMGPSGAQSLLGGAAGVAGVVKELGGLDKVTDFLGFADGGHVRGYADGGLNIEEDITPLGGAAFIPQRERLSLSTPRPMPNPVATLTADNPLVSGGVEDRPDYTSIATGDYDPMLVGEPGPAPVAPRIEVAPLPAPTSRPRPRPTGGLSTIVPTIAQPQAPQGGLTMAQEAPVAQPAVDPAAALRARAEKLYDSVRPPEERLKALQAARDKLAQKSAPTLGGEKLLALAAGLLSPTRSGSFGESIGNALNAMAPVSERARRAALDQENRLLQLDTRLAEAGLRGDDRLLANAARFDQAANRVEDNRERSEDRKAQMEMRREEMVQRAADRKVQQAISAGHLGIALKQLERGNYEPAGPGPEGPGGERTTLFVDRNNPERTKVVPIDFGAIAGGGRQSAERDRATLYADLIAKSEAGDQTAARVLDMLGTTRENPEASKKILAGIIDDVRKDVLIADADKQKEIKARWELVQSLGRRSGNASAGAPASGPAAASDSDWPIGAPPPPTKRELGAAQGTIKTPSGEVTFKRLD